MLNTAQEQKLAEMQNEVDNFEYEVSGYYLSDEKKSEVSIIVSEDSEDGMFEDDIESEALYFEMSLRNAVTSMLEGQPNEHDFVITSVLGVTKEEFERIQ